MIKFHNLESSMPYQALSSYYEKALSAGQKSIEAISISSYDINKKEVNSRFVNLKFIDKDKWIFFTNYDSPKSKEFLSHSQISGLMFWNKINLQIRVKAKIKRTEIDFNKNYFKDRSKKKNALAISSNQSMPIESYQDVVTRYEKTLIGNNLEDCPDYWGGFSFTPYIIEFWEGHESRLNKRTLFKKQGTNWEKVYLQP